MRRRRETRSNDKRKLQKKESLLLLSPQDVRREIFSHLPLRDKKEVRLTNKTLCKDVDQMIRQHYRTSSRRSSMKSYEIPKLEALTYAYNMSHLSYMPNTSAACSSHLPKSQKIVFFYVIFLKNIVKLLFRI